MAIIVIRGNPDDSAGTMNKKCPQMLVAFFRHIHPHLPVATRMQRDVSIPHNRAIHI